MDTSAATETRYLKCLLSTLYRGENNQMATIRLITAHDVDAVVALHDDNCLESAGHRMNPTTYRNVHKMFSRYVDNLLAYAYVAEEDGRIVGYLASAIMYHPAMSGASGELEDMYIVPEYRRRKIGTQLVQTAVATLREIGKVGIIRTMACIDNTDVRAFWLSLGYENDLVAFSLYN
jgi:GNAT superfamily N-acetyltransferase